MSFENSALLVKLQIGKWTGKKDDKAAEREIASAHQVQGSFGEVKKDLVSRVALKSITEAESAIRTFHAKHTQPWSPGVAILPSAIYFEYVRGLAALKENYQYAVEAFVNNYSVLKSDSKLRLGDKYDDDDYPSADNLKSRFYVQTDFIPLASSSGIVLDLASEDLKKVQDEYSKTLSEMERSSVSASYSALGGAITNLLERLLDPTTARLNTMDKVKETAQLVRKMNVMKSDALDAVCADILATVCICSMEDIKQDTLLQQTVMDAATEVKKKIDLVKPQQ